jgi:hypothetical protein
MVRLLVPVQFGPVELELCGHCRGVWLDHGEVAEVSHESLSGASPTMAELVLSRGQRRGGTDMRCPKCEGSLVTYRFADYEALEIEFCEDCGGVWLERGELAQIQRSRSREVLEQLTGQSLRQAPR